MTDAQLQGISGLLASPEHVLATSRPRPRLPVMHLALIALVGTIAGMVFTDVPTDAASLARKIVPILVPLGVLAFALCWGAHLAAELRAEERAVANAEDALQTDHLDRAAHILANMTSVAMYSPLSRARLLAVYVGTLLGVRRFEEVTRATGQMLAEGVPTEMAPTLWSAMAYALLREDRLVDAGRAIHELRKFARSESSAPAEAMLITVEMYRDVSSGHPDEVLEALEKKRPALAAALGHRVSDADALAALAAHLRQKPELAAVLWHRATLLQPAGDLLERYPELRALSVYPVADSALGVNGGSERRTV